MNEIEKRRLQLLEETRNQYRATYNPPAIHPRYQSAFKTVYQEDEVMMKKHTWLVRFMIAILIFSLFYLMDTQNKKIGTLDSQKIIQEVQRDLFCK